MSSSSDSVSLSSSSSESIESGRSVGRRVEEESSSPAVVVGRIPMETVTEVREDPPEEMVESNWLAKAGYEWIASDICVNRGIISLEQVSAIDRICHGQEGVTKKFFYMYMCHFSQLHVRLPLDDITMGVLRELNVAPTQLHPNSSAYMQAFRPVSRLQSHPSISGLDAFSQSFKHFKDGYFKVVVKEEGMSYFLNADGSTKFSFSWTGTPSRYKDMGTDELSTVDKEVVEVLMKFSDKLPTKGLVRSRKKNLALFQALRKEIAAKAKTVGNTVVPNLQESLVEVHVHGGTKRKAELPAQPGKGKDLKKVRAALLGPGSSSGAKGPEFGLIELPETSVRKDMDINLPEIVINSIDSIEPDHLVRTMVEFGSKALILSPRVGSLYR
ncbi:hypothetical protein DEO72_LG8g1889 [Vigna unguiculata]|uniref:Transposase n=1 Tax=Vigna unguiculata TaxID=3917 RepID=A0A4D6MQQ4_VIGUN|nr:hypothetical protein DEO72_LG8g1889 [Vigna unguiculata]